MNDRRRNTFRIDYDKLAEAIVKAQNGIDNGTNKEDIKNAIIEANDEIEKEKTRHTYSGEVLSFLVSPIMGVFSAIGLCFMVATIYTVVKQWHTLVTSLANGIVVILLTTGFMLIGGTLTYISFKASKESRDTNDFNLLSTVLMSLTSFVAMVVSVVALIISIKG